MFRPLMWLSSGRCFRKDRCIEILQKCLNQCTDIKVKVEVKQSHNRPGVAERVPGGLGSQVSRHLTHEGGEVSLTHRPPLTPGMFLVLIFTRGWVYPRAMVRSEGNMSLKNPVTPPGIDPGTVRPVAQRLNHYDTPCPIIWYYTFIIIVFVTF